MTVVGSVDHYINSGTSFTINPIPPSLVTAVLGSTYANRMFVIAYNFLNNNTGSIGIERIAYNVGHNGNGMNYYEESDGCGDNAWACFKFASADIPFYILLQSSITASLGESPGNPGYEPLLIKSYYPLEVAEGEPPAYGYIDYETRFAYQFAQRSDGGDCWNGTTNNDGTDTKGDPVWISGSSNLAVYPINNNFITGVTAGVESKDLMRPFFVFETNSYPTSQLEQLSAIRFNLLADENNILMFGDGLGKNSIHYFGKLNTLTQSYSNMHMQCPYFYVCNSFVNPSTVLENLRPLIGYYDIDNFITNNSLKTLGIIYGSVGNITYDYYYDGGAFSHTPSNGVYPIYFDMPSRHRSISFYLNYNFDPPRLDAIPLDVILHNGGSYAGKTNNFLRLVGGSANRYDVTDDMQYTIIGDNEYDSTSVNNVIYQNLLVPWGGGIVPGTITNMSGVQF